MAEKKEKKNIKAVTAFRLKGRPIERGEVVAKDEFTNKGDWQNLVNMTPQRAEETDESVGKPKAEKAKGDKLPGA